MKTTAIVIARAGSVRLPDKNVQDFHGRPLVAHKVWQLRQCKRIEEVVVGSDSDVILDAAQKEGAVVMKRGPEFCDEKTRSWNDVIADMVDRISGYGVIVWAHCTNPCIQPETYDNALETFFGENCDSLIGVTELKTHIWYEDKPLNFNPEAARHQVAAGLKPVYVQHGGLFIAPRSLMARRQYVFGTSPLLFSIHQDEAIDVDTWDDLERARLMYEVVCRR